MNDEVIQILKALEVEVRSINPRLDKMNGAISANIKEIARLDKEQVIQQYRINEAEKDHTLLATTLKELNANLQGHKDKNTEKTIEGYLRQYGYTIMFVFFLLALVADFLKGFILK